MVQHCAAWLRKCTSQVKFICNEHALMQNDTVWWFCGWLPTSRQCVSPQPWQWLYWNSFLIGTTASEYVTAWRQWHDVHVVVLVVVLCTMENWHALVRRLTLVQSSFSQYKDAKRSKKMMDAYQWHLEYYYTKEIHQNFVWWSKPSKWDGQSFSNCLIGLWSTMLLIPWS